MNELLNGIVKGIVDTKARAHGRVQIKKIGKEENFKGCLECAGQQEKNGSNWKGSRRQGKGALIFGGA